MSNQFKRPLALTIDDDPDFNRIMQHIMRRLGVDVHTTTKAEDFLSALRTMRPSICMVDLNLGDMDAGFTIIKAVRSVLGPELPLLVVSLNSDSQSIAHALEIGANDFITKPIDQDMLVTKLRRFIELDTNIEGLGEQVVVPPDYERAYLSLMVEITEVDELGVKFVSNHLVSKGTPLYLEHPFIHSLTAKEHPVLTTVTSTWVEPDGVSCGAYAEFDETDEELRASVRRWIAANLRKD
jgi:CheY-like chemotaxis protein